MESGVAGQGGADATSGEDRVEARPGDPGSAGAVPAPAVAQGTTEMPATGSDWRADISTFVAGTTCPARGRAASAAGVA
eukprot:1889383-Pleurochrysis_carterae.AAC.1